MEKIFPPIEYASACPHRYSNSIGKNSCQLISQTTDFESEITPKQCAQCCIDGKPNSEFVLSYSLNLFSEMMDYILLKFYSEDKALDIMGRFYQTLSKSREPKPFMDKFLNTVKDCMRRQLISPEKLEKFIVDKIPEFKEIMQDKELAQPCPTCPHRQSRIVAQKETLGILGYVTAKLSGETKQEIQDNRFAICNGCTAKDTEGSRLFRKVNGVYYCGKPWEIEFRNQEKDGCGCDLKEKVKYKKSECPRGHWGHAKD